MIKIASILLLSICLANAQKFPIRAMSLIGGGIVAPDMKDPIVIMGDIRFLQESAMSPVVVNLNITFFPADASLSNIKRGLHIHTFGVSSIDEDPTKTCMSTGPHWNPAGTNHGFLGGAESHDGDLGNVVIEPVHGRIVTEIRSSKLQLTGVTSIIGRSVVLHEKPDDGGMGNTPQSLVNGNAGNRIACGSIVFDKL